MSLQFVMGGAGSGKTRYLYETAIKQAVEQPDRLFLFVVPEQYTMQTQKELVRLHPRKGREYAFYKDGGAGQRLYLCKLHGRGAGGFTDSGSPVV